MIINTVDVDATQQNIVMSAGVKQETEKGHNVLTFPRTPRQNMYYG